MKLCMPSRASLICALQLHTCMRPVLRCNRLRAHGAARMVVFTLSARLGALSAFPGWQLCVPWEGLRSKDPAQGYEHHADTQQVMRPSGSCKREDFPGP